MECQTALTGLDTLDVPWLLKDRICQPVQHITDKSASITGKGLCCCMVNTLVGVTVSAGLETTPWTLGGGCSLGMSCKETYVISQM